MWSKGPDKTAGAGGGGAEFDDQVADLGCGRKRADPVPAGQPSRKSKPRIWPRRADRMAVIFAVARTGRRCHLMDRLQQHRRALRQRLGTPIRAAVRNARSEESTL